MFKTIQGPGARRRRARSLLLAVVCGGVIAGGLSLATPPDAYGSPGTFLQALNQRGMYITDVAKVLAQGQLICAALNDMNGADVYDVLRQPQFGYNAAEAQALVLSSVTELCPWHDHTKKWMI